MSPELAEYIKELEIELKELYNSSMDDFERGQIHTLEEIIEKLKEIESHY